jgi:hypothetical protein
MDQPEVQLIEIMVKLVVRFPDGLERIESALETVVAAGIEMAQDPFTKPMHLGLVENLQR